MSPRSTLLFDPDLPDHADALPSVSPAAARRHPARRRKRPGIFAIVTLDRLFVATICAASIGFFAIAYTISVNDPDYFSRRLLASLPNSEIDPMITGAIAAATAAGDGGAMPVPRIVRDKPLVPQDFQIVMVFEDEAILSTGRELFRVKVGSVVPGLGAITGIEATDGGGTVVAAQATLRSVTQ